MKKKIEGLEKVVGEKMDVITRMEDTNGAMNYKHKQLEKKLRDDIHTLKVNREEQTKKIETLEKQKTQA